MSASSVESYSELLAQPGSAGTVGVAPSRRLIGLAKLAVVGGSAFAIGFLGMVVLRSFGLAFGLASIVSGVAVAATVVSAWYHRKFSTWRDVVEELCGA